MAAEAGDDPAKPEASHGASRGASLVKNEVVDRKPQQDHGQTDPGMFRLVHGHERE